MPFLNLDDNFADHPKVDGLTDGAFRELVRDICAWSKSGDLHRLTAEIVTAGHVRRTPLDQLPHPLRVEQRSHRSKIPTALRIEIYDRDGWTCVTCHSTEDLTLDHIVPWSLGGADTHTNLQTLCRPCNARKGART